MAVVGVAVEVLVGVGVIIVGVMVGQGVSIGVCVDGEHDWV